MKFSAAALAIVAISLPFSDSTVAPRDSRSPSGLRFGPPGVRPKLLARDSPSAHGFSSFEARSSNKKSEQPLRYLTRKTKPFFVDGKGIPEVSWDVGESYAGLIPISKNKTEDRRLWFWFFPKATPDADDTLTIWLNGGPGCSSLEGLLQENGPFLWQPGTFKPVPNPFSWTNLTNMLWVEQPVGTGFSQGTPNIHSSTEAAEQFLGFFENFIDTFQLYNKKIYITGESYAGIYIPYLADAFYKRKGASKRMIKSPRAVGSSGNSNSDASVLSKWKKYFDLRGTLLYDPVIADWNLGSQVPAYPYVKYWEHLFALGSEAMSKLEKMHEVCGYKAWVDKYFTFPPPKGGMPPFPDALMAPPPSGVETCDIWTSIFNATLDVNPCFNMYHITDTCPLLWDVLGFPGSFNYLPEGTEIYFNRTDVKKAIHAPLETNWQECSSIDVFVDGIDTSDFTIIDVLPRVIEKSERTIISHGLLDFILMTNGTLMSIQNMTWAGERGFQVEPKPESFVLNDPYAVFGKVHTERGLTWVEVEGAGHMGPQYQPEVAYKLVEYLLGRRKDL